MEARFDFTELYSRVRELQKRGTDTSAMMAVVAEGLVGEVSDMFDTAGHGTWAALAASTIRKRGEGAQILKDTGRWAASNFPNHGPMFAEVFTDVSYAIFHVDAKARPVRNPYDLPDSAIEDASQTILDMLVSGAA